MKAPALITFFLAAAVDPLAVLSRVAEVYQQVIDYNVRVETTVANGVDPVTRSLYQVAASKPRALYTLERVQSPRRYVVQLGTDGKVVWAYSPSNRLYVLDGGAELAGNLREQHFRLFRRFEVVDRAAVEVRFEG